MEGSLVDRLGGWTLKTARLLAYTISANPKATVQCHGFADLDAFHPTHAYLIPPDELIDAVFGVVLVRVIGITSHTENMTVSEAISACKEHHSASKEKDLPAYVFFEVLLFLARALLQVCTFHMCPSTCVPLAA